MPENRAVLKCKGRAKTDTDEDDGNVCVILTQPHTCVPSPTTAEATRIRSNILQEATNSQNLSKLF